MKKSFNLFLLYLDNRYFLFLGVLYEKSYSTKEAAQFLKRQVFYGVQISLLVLSELKAS